ncbi:hypothetical protein C0J52_07097 [Blattella germanica]|nr:hypothetical protein C0J52_07097 [Blattella germanica]
MKFAEHLSAHITPEWRKQYISYEEMKAMLYVAVEEAPSAEVVEPEVLRRHFANFDEHFFHFCDLELKKINTFYSGFRKILKKHDKLLAVDSGTRWRQEHVETSHINTNKDIDRLINETENTVTNELEGGDRQRAMKRLRVPPLGEQQSPWTTFKVGLFSGSFIVLFLAVILSGFADFWLADQLNSLVYALLDFQFLICFYVTNGNWLEAGDYYEDPLDNPYLYLWFAANILSSCYAYTWDIKMDWGLLDSSATENKILREETVYSSTVNISVAPIDSSDQTQIVKMMDDEDGVIHRRKRKPPKKKEEKQKLIHEESIEEIDSSAYIGKRL